MSTERRAVGRPESHAGWWAEYLTVWNEPITEGLQGASCSPACKAIATCAALAWDRGWSARHWYDDLRDRHHDPEDLKLINEAVQCMQGSGLWPWHAELTPEAC